MYKIVVENTAKPKGFKSLAPKTFFKKEERDGTYQADSP